MSKDGERAYLRKLSKKEREASFDLYASANPGVFFAELGALLTLLPPPPARLLDLGCGAGVTSSFFAKRGYCVVGQDICKDAIKQAKKLQEREGLTNLKFNVGDYENMGYYNIFDIVVFKDSLHHAMDEELAITQAYRALKPGGICITSEPGTGHADSEDSQKAIKKYGVTEKDMSPQHIIQMGKIAGFKEFYIYPSSSALNIVLYGKLEDIKRAKIPRFFFKLSFFRSILAFILMTVYTRDQGIVVMRK